MEMAPGMDPGPDLLAEEAAVLRLVRLERFLRDQGAWESLAACYIDDSVVRTTWFEGSGREFADASRVMAANGRHSKHMIWPGVVRVAGDRALSESPAAIMNRSVIDGIEVDMIQWCRFHSRVVRRDDGWRLASFEGIYQKDEIRPVWPGSALPGAWREEVSQLRPSYRIWAWAMLRRGYEVSSELLGDDRPDLLSAFYAGEDRWLERAAAS
jgi:SnoaL-like domain